MKILFLGNFEAEFSSENYYKRTLENMGHSVYNVQEGKQTYNELTHYVDAFEPDYFFWVHTHGWSTPGIKEFLVDLRVCGIPSFAYHLDLYMGLAREPMIKNNPFFTVDHFFTVDKLMADWLNENTKCKGHFLPAGVYEGDCFLAEPNIQKYPHEIIFTGSTNYHAEWPYRSKLVAWLRDTYGDKFAHYGGGGLPTIRGKELNTLYASAKIVIGDTLCKNFNYPYYSSDRLFEVCGRGGFLIYPKIEGLEKFYEPYKEVVFYDFNDFEGLKYQIDFYLKENYGRDVVTRINGFNRTKSEHTYTHRMQTILETLAK